MAETVLMPKLGLTMTEGVVDEWYKKVGDTVKKGEAICSISSEKLTQDVESDAEGILLKIVVAAGEEAACTTPIGYIGQKGEVIPGDAVAPVASTAGQSSVVEQSVPAAAVAQPAVVAVSSTARVFISKLAKKIAKDKGVDVSQVTGTGGNGRITRRDVEKYLVTASQLTAPVATSAAPVAGGAGLTGMRKVIARNMMHSLHTTAQLTLHRKAVIDQLMQCRLELKSKLGDSVDSGAFSLNIFLLKAVALALQDVPELNSHYDGQSHQKISHINIGVAVSLDEGLMVPVITDVANKTLTQLAKDFRTVVDNAREGKVDATAKATFTITNLGSEGIEYFTPVLNTPEVGILGVGALGERLYLGADGVVQVARELPLSLTFDHQVIDGAPAAKFLSALSQYLANPYRLLV